MKELQLSIFSSMFSLLRPQTTEVSRPPCLKLPELDFSSLSPDDTGFDRNEPVSGASVKLEKKTPAPGARAKKFRKVMMCAHPYRKYYAKGMCNNCYHKFGRVKHAWHCDHSDQKLYAKGVCQGCYLQRYHSLSDPMAE